MKSRGKFLFIMLALQVSVSNISYAQSEISKDSATVLVSKLHERINSLLISNNGSSQFIVTNIENFFIASETMNHRCRDSYQGDFDFESVFIAKQVSDLKRYKWSKEKDNSCFKNSSKNRKAKSLNYITPPIFLSKSKDSFVMLLHRVILTDTKTIISSHVLYFVIVYNKAIPFSSEFIKSEHY